MKWVGKWWIQLSPSKRIISLIFVGTVVILGMTAGLRLWERSRQKPRVLMALKQLAEEAVAQEYSFAPLLEMIQEGRVEQEGYVNLALARTERLGFDSIWLNHMDMTGSHIRYRLAFQKEEKVLSSETQYQVAGLGRLDIESYLTEEKLIVRVPQIHNSYLRMNRQHLKSQYKDSLLYGVLGEKLEIPEIDVSVSEAPVFPQEKDLEKMEVMSAFLKEYKGRLPEIWEQIQMTKENETRQVLVNGIYKDCSVYHLFLPIELVQWYLDYSLPDARKEWMQSLDWKEESVDLLIYLDDKNCIYCMEITAEPEIEGVSYPTEILCYLKGEERLLDKIQIDLHLKGQIEVVNLRMDLENQWEDAKRKIYFSVRQIKPEDTKQIRLNLTINSITGESYIEYEINLPLLVSDGEHSIRRLEEPIKEPNREIVDVFELDLIGFLKFSRDFNFALFQ